MITGFEHFLIYNTARRRFEPGNLYIRDSKIIYTGPMTIECDCVLDGAGKQWLIPGLIDGHMHLESSMTTPTEFSNSVLIKGTTTVLADAHEIANVFGVPGLLAYMDLPCIMDIYYAIPSSVPSTTPALESTGGQITPEDIRRLCHHPKVIALGEMMNARALIDPEDSLSKQIIRTFHECLPLAPIEGHIPKLNGLDLAAFVANGVGSDHTQQTPETIEQRLRNGILIQIQEKSVTPENMAALKGAEGFYSLVTDDVLPDDLLAKGQLDHVIRCALNAGLTVEEAIYASTYVPAQRLNLHDRGILAAGKLADMIILSDLQGFVIQRVFKRGVDVLKQHLPVPQEAWMMQKTIRMREPVPDDFTIRQGGDQITLRVMKRNPETTFTEAVTRRVPIRDGVVDWQHAGLNLVVVFNRYGTDQHAIGFLEGGFCQPGAVATTWAHDHHNLMVVGSDPQMMCQVACRARAIQGGMVAMSATQEAEIPLRCGGIVSLEPMTSLAKQAKAVRQLMRSLGYRSKNELMSFAVLSLLVSPSLKISDKGLVHVETQELVNWYV